MCNLYSVTTNVEALRRLFRGRSAARWDRQLADPAWDFPRFVRTDNLNAGMVLVKSA
jgi:hypothetical protein